MFSRGRDILKESLEIVDSGRQEMGKWGGGGHDIVTFFLTRL